MKNRSARGILRPNEPIRAVVAAADAGLFLRSSGTDDPTYADPAIGVAHTWTEGLTAGTYEIEAGLDVVDGTVDSVTGSGTAGTIAFTPGPAAAGSGAAILTLYFPTPFATAPAVTITDGNGCLNNYTAKLSARSYTNRWELVCDTVVQAEDGQQYVIHWSARGWA